MNYEDFSKDFKQDDITNGDPFAQPTKSSVKLTKNTKGTNWEIKVVKGEEGCLEKLMEEAIRVHKELKKRLGDNE